MAVERTSHVATRARPFREAGRAPRRPSTEWDLGAALSRLAAEIAKVTRFERLVVVAGIRDDLLGAGHGVSPNEVAAFARELGRRIATDPGDADPLEEEGPLAALVSMRSPVLVHAAAGSSARDQEADEELTLIAVVEAPSTGSLDPVSDVLRSAAPALVMAAEVHALEVRLSRSVAAEQRARGENDRLDSIIQNAAVPLFVTDSDARIQLINRGAAHLLEPRPGTSPTSPRIRDLEANHAKLTGFVRDLLLHPRARHEGRLELVEPEEARDLPVLAVSTKILDERGEVTAVVTVLHDLAHEVANRQLARATGELTARNTRLEEQHSALERAARLKNEFLATMSHELRTPINAILGYNSLLRDGLFGQLTDRQQNALDRMRAAAEHLLSLINDVLDLSRVEAGKIALNPSDIEWGPFLEALSEPVRALAARKSLAYGLSISPELPGIRADPMRLRQVLLNLLTNAVKFTDRGWIELRVAPSHGGNRVQIDVTDTGIGIEESHLEVIFEEFTQVDQSSTREHGGAGLGLAISRRLIRAMGGALTVTSVPGRGSTFRVELPLTPPSAPDLSIRQPADRPAARK